MIYTSLYDVEREEEARRAFWLLFTLDRHLALSWNSNLFISDHECFVFQPLPQSIWTKLHEKTLSDLPVRTYGPTLVISGLGIFEYFLPLMTILGDVISTHHRKYHPRLGYLTRSHQDSVAVITSHLESCSKNLDDWTQFLRQNDYEAAFRNVRQNGYDSISPTGSNSWNPTCSGPAEFQATDLPKAKRSLLVILYSRFIIHVLYVLLHGKWDAISMLAPEDASQENTLRERLPLSHPQKHPIGEWIASESFAMCASHAITASEVVSELLEADPELGFMPYLFGIYLLHGSFILLLFADRMPVVGTGRNQSVEKACETIIRAHEVCVVTLPTEFQQRFRAILRATLNSVRDNVQIDSNTGTDYVSRAQDSLWESMRAFDAEPGHQGSGPGRRRADMLQARRELFDLYRWTNGSQGLAVS